MFHKFHGPLPPISVFLFTLFKNILLGIFLISIALFIGMVGYHQYEHMSWVDAFVNASMILAGMGPMGNLSTESGKIFAGIYALFSGLFFILIMGIMLVPVLHRLLHQLHMALRKESKK